MKSTISCSKLLAAVLCGAVLAGCDSIKDVREEPFTSVPPENVVLGGTILGLGTVRPLILQNNGQDVCVVPQNPDLPSGAKEIGECKFVGVPDSERSTFNLGAQPTGTPYNITVKKQPYGKTCTPTSLTGTVGPDSSKLQITCVNDNAVPRYTVTANIATAAAAQPGLKVILTTENGTCPVEVGGRTSVTFSSAECPDTEGAFHQNAAQIWGTGSNLPFFGWRVTATIPGATPLDPVTNCWVTGGPVANTGGNINDEGLPEGAPTGNVTVNVNACVFAVRAQAVYSLPTVALNAAPQTSSPPAIPAGEAISLVLRAQPSGVDVAAAKITTFNNVWTPFMEIDENGNPTTTQYGARSDIDAFYEVIVTGSPTGMTCIPGGSVVSGSNVNASTGNRTIGTSADHGYTLDGGAVLLRNPASVRVHQVWVPDKVIRCRLLPTPERQLRGVFHQGSTEVRRQVIGDAGPVTRITTNRELSVLALFEDGTYVFGFHANVVGTGCPSCGVQQGFYHYDPAQQAIRFIAFTATTTGTATDGTAGLNTRVATSAGTVPVAKTLTNFSVSTVNGRQVLEGVYTPLTTTSATTNGVTTVTDRSLVWRFIEIGPDPFASASTEIMDGAWISWDAKRKVEDRRRFFIYQHSNYNATHIGVNGIPNIQMLCYAGALGATSGSWTRLSNTSLLAAGGGLCGQYTYGRVEWDDGTETTTPNTLRVSVDNPYITPVLRNFPGRWPQSEHNNRNVRNELVPYEIRLAGTDPADPICPDSDKLTVGDGPGRPPIVMCRAKMY